MKKTQEMLHYTSAEGRPIEIPVITLTGDRPGPRCVITAGIHGCEYPPILAAMEFARETPLEEISGTVVIVPISVLPSFEGKTPYINPYDGKNPNRCFPGDPNGSDTECIVYHLFEDVIKGSDYHLDLHCGDLQEDLGTYCEYGLGYSQKADDMAREMAHYCGIKTLVESDYHRDDIGLPPGLNYINSVQNGIPAILLEIGKMGRSDRAYVEGQLYAIRNILRRFGNLDGTAIPTEDQQVLAIYVTVEVPADGVMVTCVQPGEDLKKGQKVADLYDYFGNPLCEICCECDGKVLYLNSSIAVKKGDFALNMIY